MPDSLGIVLATRDGVVQVLPGEQPRPAGDGAPDGIAVTRLDRRGDVTLAVAPDHGVWAHRPRQGWAQVWAGDARCARISPDGLWYIGAAPAALLRSADEGRSWERVETFENVLRHYRTRSTGGPRIEHAVAGIVFPAGSVLLAVSGAGAWLTRDGGGSWMPRSEGLDRDVHGVWEHPFEGERLYATARSGFYRSEDGGFSWVQSLSGLDRSYGGEVAVLPDTRDVLLLSAARRPPRGPAAEPPPADHAALFRSANGGISWRRLLLGDEDGWPQLPVVAALPDSSDTFFVAAGSQLWGSHDRGEQWLPIADDVPTAHAMIVAL